MGRRYTKENYIETYKKLKENVKNVCITTDIIVGFPGETEEDFQETLDLVNSCKFDGAFTFAYSKRTNTPASIMKNQVPEEIKLERLNKLNKIVNQYSLNSNNYYIGKIVIVLIFDICQKDNNKLVGYSEQMKLVNVVGDKNLIGKIVDVKITDAKSFSIDGEVLE